VARRSGSAIIELNAEGLAIIIVLVAVLWNAFQGIEREIRRSGPLAKAVARRSDRAKSPAATKEKAAGDDNLAHQLADISVAEPSFDATWFVDNARLVYETVLAAFAQGDRARLKELLDTDAYETFAQHIGHREAQGERLDLILIGLTRADIVDATLFNNVMRIRVAFESELIMATYGPAGTVISGDATDVTVCSDLWTFTRTCRSRNRVWKLAATEPDVSDSPKKKQSKPTSQLEMA
jgi:predicted lipid-binding transport protein (Tim44 family)